MTSLPDSSSATMSSVFVLRRVALARGVQHDVGVEPHDLRLVVRGENAGHGTTDDRPRVDPGLRRREDEQPDELEIRIVDDLAELG